MTLYYMPTADNRYSPLPAPLYELCLSVVVTSDCTFQRKDDLLAIQDRETIYVYRIVDDELAETDLTFCDMNYIDARGELLGWIHEDGADVAR